MADQTFKAKFKQQGESIDYTPGSAVAAGSVNLIGNMPLPAKLDIAANILGALETEGVFVVVKDASVFVAGDPVYWNPTGNPVGGTAGTGAATLTGGGAYLMGMCILAAATGAVTVDVKLTPGARSVAPSIPTATVVALGTNQATAAPLATGFSLVTGADGAVGVLLPAAAAGLYVEIKNGTAAALKVYPNTSDTINAIAANGAYTMASLTSAIFRAYDGVAWYTTPLVAS